MHVLAISIARERDVTFCKSKQGVVFALAYILPSVKTTADLSYDNIAWHNMLAAVCLNASVLRIGRSAVFCTTASFLMSHD